MKKVIKIGTIILTYPMWVEESLQDTNVSSVEINNVDGGKIVFNQYIRNSAQNVTLISKDSGWQKEDIVADLISLANSSIDTDIQIQYNDLTTENVRFNYTQAVQFDPIYEGADYYKGKIKFRKI